jgi:hypothetical protein
MSSYYHLSAAGMRERANDKLPQIVQTVLELSYTPTRYIGKTYDISAGVHLYYYQVQGRPPRTFKPNGGSGMAIDNLPVRIYYVGHWQ